MITPVAHPACQAALKRALRWTPGGAQTMSKQAARFPETGHPLFVQEAIDERVTCPDGHHYIDHILGLGAIPLGHHHRLVEGWVVSRSRWGASLPSELETEVAEELADVWPCMGSDSQARFVLTGSEAAEAAIRTARLATGRAHIVSVGYHGWHSALIAAKPWRPGVPDGYAAHITETTLAGVSKALADYPGDVAAVFVEPVLLDPVTADELRAVQALAHAHGALLIFDEIVTGYRWGLGGAQEYYGVTPDLATIGKGMGNGYPVAALIGPRRYMRHARLVSGTHGGHPLGLAAALGVLAACRDPGHDPIQAQWRAGHRWLAGVQAAIGAVGLNDRVRLRGYAVHPQVVIEDDPEHALLTAFLTAVAGRGVLLHPGGFNMSAAHTDAVIDRSVAAVGDALEQLRPYCDGRLTWDGPRLQPSSLRVTT